MKKQWILPGKDINSLVSQIKNFWQTDTIDFSFLEGKELPNFRKSENFEQYNTYFALTWFQMAKKCAPSYVISTKYDRNKLEELSRDLHKYTISADGITRFIEKLNCCGIIFFVLSHLQKTYIDGASFFDGTTPVIVCTGRHDRIDNFWFTIAHEIAHVLLHLHTEDDFFIDIQSEEEKDSVSIIEQEANDLAATMVKAQEILQYFERFSQYISHERVLACANLLCISPAVVVGVLQYYGKLSRKNLNRFKISAKESIPLPYFVEKEVENE